MMRRSSIRQSLLTTLVLSTGLAFNTVNAAPPAHAKSYGRNAPFKIKDLPPGLLRKQLEALPANAKSNALRRLNNIHFHSHDLKFMRVDKTGGIFFEDTFLPAASSQTFSAANANTGLTQTQVFSLHSKPGSANTIYLDFDGHIITGTAWNNTTNIDPLNAKAFDPAGNGSEFLETELDAIVGIWRRIAEDYAPFDVNITTADPDNFGPTVSRLLITASTTQDGRAMPSRNAGGVAYVDVWGDWGVAEFGNRYFSPALVYYDNLNNRTDYVAEAGSHEVGHNLGLNHDGTTRGRNREYYGGVGSGDISWAPIMGNSYGKNVSQWSEGDYSRANNSEDDISVIGDYLGINPDDHVNTAALDITNGISQSGVISTVNDIDYFSFTTGDSSRIAIRATPLREGSNNTAGGNLDIKLTLLDSAGNIEDVINPALLTDASIETYLEAGTYYLAVEGSGSANYPKYGSLGQYFISGTIDPVDPVDPVDDPVENTAPTASDDTASVKKRRSVSINILGNDSDPDGDDLTVKSFTQGGKGSVERQGDSLVYRAGRSRGSDSFTYTISDGQAESSATVTVRIR